MKTLHKKTCERCTGDFFVPRYRLATARFCSGRCRALWVASLPGSMCGPDGDRSHLIGNRFREGKRPANSFEPGHKPWNDGVKGIRLSPATEFKPGPRPDRRADIGAISFRKTHDGNLRAFVKVAHPDKWKLRAIKVWEDANGPVPRGKIIHHDDRDTLNDDLENLMCLTKAEHIIEHQLDLQRARGISL